MNKLLLHVGRSVFACLLGGCPPLCLSTLASVLLSEQAASSRWQVCVCLSVGRCPPLCLSTLASVLLSEQAASSRWQVCVCLSVGRLPPVVSVYISKCSVE